MRRYPRKKFSCLRCTALRAPRSALVFAPHAPRTKRAHARATRPLRRALPAPQPGRAGREGRADGRVRRCACGPDLGRVRGRAQDVGVRARPRGVPRSSGRTWDDDDARRWRGAAADSGVARARVGLRDGGAHAPPPRSPLCAARCRIWGLGGGPTFWWRWRCGIYAGASIAAGDRRSPAGLQPIRARARHVPEYPPRMVSVHPTHLTSHAMGLANEKPN
ncbi:hypothetical protein BC826DRAFT_1001366, partial [Russula brevipes]